MIVAGVMSGTSADGINVALVRISDAPPTTKTSSKNTSPKLSFRLLGHCELPYPKAVRRAVLEMMNATSAQVADMALLNSGMSNKLIAREYDISPRTIEVYRANVMTKMQAGSLSELVRLAMRAGVIKD